MTRFLRKAGWMDESTYYEMTVLFPRGDSGTVIVKLPFSGEVEGTPVHAELRELAAVLDEEKYVVRDVELHVQNAVGITTFVVTNE